MSHLEQTIAGYTMYRRGQRYSTEFEMYVPCGLADKLNAEDERKRQEKLEAERIQRAMEDEIDYTPARVKTTTATATVATAAGTGKLLKAKESIEHKQARSTWEAIARKDKEKDNEKDKDKKKGKGAHASYPVFDHQQAIDLHDRMALSEPDERERFTKIYQRLVERGTAHRTLAQAPSMAALDALEQKQPHMKEVTRFVREQLQLARLSTLPIRLQPMLLVGEPGVGKTHFAQALASALATTIHVQQLDSDLTNSLLLGSDRKWGNSQAGLLFELLVLGQHANPIVVLDEIDKAQRNLSYGSAVNGLYSVLEPLTARRLRDISLLFEFDASQVVWIATANDATRLEPALRSRFREFHVLPPDAQECLVLAQEVMRAAVDSAGVKDFVTDYSIKRHLAHLPARQIWQLTREALGRAVAQGRRHFILKDLPDWLIESESDAPKSPTYQLH